MSESIVTVCPTSDVAENSVKRFEVGERVLAVYNLGGAYFVTDDECTHGAASLSDGVLDGDVIECTMHFGAFDIRMGEVVSPPCSIPLRTYKVIVKGDQVCVDLDKKAGE